jgi:diaminohydroxyphosphoribosylaminopyrimidine deaminase/5-amino-6-(5-phosphoribosylamino)uracil reductase
MTSHELYIQRCFDLAKKGLGTTSPNPIVGAVLVYDNRIIGEGWHQKYGSAHAEVNCLKSVKEDNKKFISKSTLYVSLEPCCIFGKTPPCTNLILENKIPKVVISCLDLTPNVAGNGVEILRKNGVEVITGILEKRGQEISAVRSIFVTQNRPYIILKYAQSQDGIIGKENEQIWITNSLSKRLVHKWRAESAAIMVGTNTAKIDNPSLTTRHYFGKSPLRIVLDKDLKLERKLSIFSGEVETWIINEKRESDGEKSNLKYIQIPFDGKLLPQLLNRLFEKKHNTLLVEGGAYTLQKFINQNLWDEARILTGNVWLENGIKAPFVPGSLGEKYQIGTDTLTIIKNPSSIS